MAMSAAKRLRARSEANARAIGPQVPGGTYPCAYWQQRYEVLAIASPVDGAGFPVFTVRWLDGPDSGCTVSHCTAWDARRDRVVSVP
jgi:hypothetical protein